MEKHSTNGILEDFRIDFLECWRRLPNKGLFIVLFAAWLALFHLLGNSTLGYVHSSSLFRYMLDAYHPNLWGWLQTLDFAAISHWMGEGEEGHCLLVPLVVLGLFWWKRRELMALPLGLWWPGLVVLGLALTLHLFGFLIQQPRLSILALFLGLYAMMGVAWGPAWLRGSFFPFFLLAFCIPMGVLTQPITFHLRLLVCQLVKIVVNSVLVLNIQSRGTQLFDSTGRYQYEVAAACSGMRSLMATFGLAVVFAFLSFHKWWKRLLLIGSAFPLAILGNLLRMLAIIIAAEFFGGQSAGNYVHNGGPMGVFSLLPYVPAFFGLFLLGSWLGEREGREEGRLPAEAKGSACP
jgi:exosortase